MDSLITRLSGDEYGMWAVLVELLLIGLCVNWCASVLHGTRGTRPLRGVLIMLVVATVVVRGFGWVRLDLLYSYVLIGLAFIGLVVFQPELRRAVIRAGDVRFRKSREPPSQLVAALVKSAKYLSRNRYGALIAIQRQVDLSGWAENGTLINAEVSANLLNSIFFPNSPLHDLAVIIRGHRLVAANCQLPSAESDEIDAALGSRHLAAVGMSYETDALVLIVSEETGVISLADNGKLTRYLSLDDLSEELTERLRGRTTPSKREAGKRKPPVSLAWGAVRRLLVVIPLTLVIWYLADQATLDTVKLNLQLHLRHENPSYVVDVEGPRPLVFGATFNGPVRRIDRLLAVEQPLQVSWELAADYARGEYTLGADQIQNIVSGLREPRLRGLGVVSVDLKELSFQVDEVVTLRVPVRAEAERLRIAVERIDPPEVDVVVRRGDLPDGWAQEDAYAVARVGKLLGALAPGITSPLERVRVSRQLMCEDRSEPIDAVRISPEEVSVRLSVVGQPKRIENVVVHLYVSPDVAENYRVEQVDLNEWRIGFEVEGAEATVGPLGAHSFDAFARVTSEMVPPAGQIDEPLLRAIEVTVVPKQPGVTVIGRRTVRVNLIPRPGSAR